MKARLISKYATGLCCHPEVAHRLRAALGQNKYHSGFYWSIDIYPKDELPSNLVLFTKGFDIVDALVIEDW